jgi:hypothetical protein
VRRQQKIQTHVSTKLLELGTVKGFNMATNQKMQADADMAGKQQALSQQAQAGADMARMQAAGTQNQFPQAAQQSPGTGGMMGQRAPGTGGMMGQRAPAMAMKKGGKVPNASKRADGIAQRGKTKGRIV